MWRFIWDSDRNFLSGLRIEKIDLDDLIRREEEEWRMLAQVTCGFEGMSISDDDGGARGAGDDWAPVWEEEAFVF